MFDGFFQTDVKASGTRWNSLTMGSVDYNIPPEPPSRDCRHTKINLPPPLIPPIVHGWSGRWAQFDSPRMQRLREKAEAEWEKIRPELKIRPAD